MKKPIIFPIIVALLLGGVAFAQEQTVLPKAGLTPESPFYFLDKLGETLQEFFTFNPEGKARLQITFVSERVAEINVILETKGVEAKGLQVAQSRLQASLAKAAAIVNSQKSKGKDVSSLAKELDDKLETPKSALAQGFKEQKQVLGTRADELKAQLRAAHLAGDTAKEEALAQELGQVKAQQELLELKEEDIGDELEAEEERIEEEIEAESKAEKAINEAQEEKQEVLDEATEEGVELPADAFVEFDNLLSQAQAAFQAGLSAEASAKEGNFAEARQLAKKAEKSLERVEDVVEELEEQTELREEAEEAIEEAEEELAQVQADAQEEDVDVPADAFGKFNSLQSQAKSAFEAASFKEAKRLAEQAEKALDDAEKAIEKVEKEKEKQEEKVKKEEEKQQKEVEKQQKEVEKEQERAEEQDQDNEEER